LPVRSFVLLAALLSLVGCVTDLTSSSSGSPCETATPEEVRTLIGSEPVDVPADQLGEATVPYCLWATAGRTREMKVEVWSAEDMEAILQTDPQTYYEKLWHDAGSVRTEWSGAGDAAFYSPYESPEGTERAISIVVRKDDRIILFDGQNLDPDAALKFAARISTRM
jgi:hypothetical protein